MAQYKHDRFFKFYVQALYKTKGETLKNIQVRNDEDLEIDCMFVAQSDKWGLPAESLTEEEQEFMRTMQDVDAWYEAEIAKAEQKAKQENQQAIALKMLRENIPVETISRITELSISELEGFANDQLQQLRSN